MWTIGIHDKYTFLTIQINMIQLSAFWTANNYINGAAHHTIHHLEFNYNYGQYSTFWDKLFGTHKFPETLKGVEAYFDKALKVVIKKEE